MPSRLLTVALIAIAAALAVVVLVRELQPSHGHAGWTPPMGSQLTDLVIVFHPDTMRKHSQRFTLHCTPAGGTLPRPAAACRLLTAARPFQPLPRKQACTMIYGGPETAVVHGVYRDKPVRATLTRRNGCEIARFRWLGVLLGAHAATAGPAAGTAAG